MREVAVKRTLRVDILATLGTRLLNYLTINKIKPTKVQLKNIQAFMKIDFIPNDIRMTMLQDAVSSKNKHLKAILADRHLAKLLLKRM